MLDKVTEMVAHMIGIFHTTIEEERMRDSYQKIAAQRKAEPDTGPLRETSPTMKSPFQLEDFNPGVQYADQATPAAPVWYGPFLLGVPQLGPMNYWQPAELLPRDIENNFTFSMVQGRPILTLDPPGSVVTITYQSAYLSDNDLLRLSDTGTVFVDPSVFEAQLQGYQAIAQVISAPLSMVLPPLGASVHDHAVALHDQISTVTDPGFTGAVVTVLHGSEASGVVENGVVVEKATTLDDVMPAYFKAQTEKAEADANDALDALPEWAADPFQGLQGAVGENTLFDPEPGHAVVAGANLMVNQTSITFAWLDAPVIVVMGDVISLNIITQVNMLVEQGEYTGLGSALGSATYNSAAITLQSSMPAVGEGASAAQGPDGPLSFPMNWAVTRIDGDLLNVNYVQQYSFVTDHDRADIAFTSAETYIALGDNTVINITSLLEIGYGYDMIIIGGHMITINQINQLNVLIDSDHVTYGGALPTTFSAGDNLLFNGASISVTGLDSYQAMQGNFATAAQDLAVGGRIDERVTHDGVFEGIDILRVLYISGDATTINMVDQTNILGDSDQVHLALDNFQTGAGAEITVTTGSNAVINLASISQFGVDSTVSVGGAVYSDALIYQAGFVDTDANPLGVAMPALAAEAVVFLADGMIGPDAPPDDMSIAPTAIPATHSPDVMQSMLA
ncbi:hypothetical protein SAMN05216227_105411 [Pseudorhodobacter antarcticus]|uniref:Uncharacterized protein n=1 Tax=Pseudorhodobacter antarcticus TaxID=1077947 RepID=A0A1H8MFM3_9RHOB|nr:hypothetical protein [Pseudorhodobacter antarcticus]SEO15946.1 hypothetical protein SAMN05216227_105411 [Pseudorhodobacter antarcticus]